VPAPNRAGRKSAALRRKVVSVLVSVGFYGRCAEMRSNYLERAGSQAHGSRMDTGDYRCLALRFPVFRFGAEWVRKWPRMDFKSRTSAIPSARHSGSNPSLLSSSPQDNNFSPSRAERCR